MLRFAILPAAVLLMLPALTTATPLSLASDESLSAAAVAESASTYFPWENSVGSMQTVDPTALIQTSDPEQLAAQMLETTTIDALAPQSDLPEVAPYAVTAFNFGDVPEPSSFLLLATGLLALSFGAWRTARRKAQAS